MEVLAIMFDVSIAMVNEMIKSVIRYDRASLCVHLQLLYSLVQFIQLCLRQHDGRVGTS